MAEPQIIYRVAAHLSSKGDLAKSMQQKAQAVGALSSRFDAATAKVMAFGRANTSAITASAAAVGRYAAVAAGLTLGAGLGLAVKEGIALNMNAESTRNTIAGTLQLMNHSAGAADQLGTNIKVAGAAMVSLNRIADESPGELQDVQDLFKNMLPGAHAATGEMQRILKLTQNAALFTPTLTQGDFGLTGSQISRSLTGGAGSEMEVFRTLGPAFVEVGQQMDKIAGKGKIFANDMQPGEKLTMAFNKLDRLDRLRLFEKVFDRGGPALAEMYKSSWASASSRAKSSVKKIGQEFGKPVYESLKTALLKAGNDPNSAFGEKNKAKLMSMGSILGGLLNKPMARMIGLLERGVDYLSNNWESVANTTYHALQVGALMIKGAFTFGVARLMLGVAALSAATAGRAGLGVARGVGKGAGMVSSGVGVVTKFAKGIKDVIDTMDRSSPISNVMGLFTTVGRGVGMLAAGLVVLVPMLLIAGVLFGALSLGIVAVSGVAAYLISKWDELSASLRTGFQNGTFTLRPLIIAALLLWERLKRLGEVFLGATTGAGLMERALNAAVWVVDSLSSGVAMLTRVAATFLDMMAGAYDLLHPIDALGRAGDIVRIQEVMSGGLASDIETAKKIVERRKKEGVYDSGPLALSTSERMTRLSGNLREAADTMDSVGLKDLDLKGIDDLTKRADSTAEDLLAGDSKSKDKARGTNVNIGTLVQQFDLRGEDPDRAMVAWVEPIERLARAPGGSTLDMGGF